MAPKRGGTGSASTSRRGDQAGEVDRLVSLGATRLEVGEDGAVVLADPDGNEFGVRVD